MIDGKRGEKREKKLAKKNLKKTTSTKIEKTLFSLFSLFPLFSCAPSSSSFNHTSYIFSFFFPQRNTNAPSPSVPSKVPASASSGRRTKLRSAPLPSFTTRARFGFEVAVSPPLPCLLAASWA